MSAPAGTEFDPHFVGEFLNDPSHHAAILPLPNQVRRDWRLFFDSPLVDKGLAPTPGQLVWGQNGSSFTEAGCEFIKTFNWDGEEFGNPRVVNGAPDIGFDETHLLIVAGSHGNDSLSHNLINTPALLNAKAPPGITKRYFILPIQAVNGSATMNARIRTPVAPVSAWTTPPGVISPLGFNQNLPPDFQTQYISFNNPGCSPTQQTDGWHFATFLAVAYGTAPVQPPGFVASLFAMGSVVDDDTQPSNPNPPPPLICPAVLESYFNIQADVIMGDPAGQQRWSNLQAEYR